ncbi:MAG TPA: NAD+ synthase [Gemmatimonadaceae bacterium]|jgi:NAD+ synthetase|nr:NAD+ synthase [Gemmatimonadaceae bacterium]
MPPIIQLATAQFAPIKGEYTANLRRIGDMLARLAVLPSPPQLVHLPEASPTGYFVEGGVRELAVTAGKLARDLHDSYLAAMPDAPRVELVLGFYELWRHNLYNSAMCVRIGGDEPIIRQVHRKNFLPTYGLFDEERFVERGQHVRAFDTPWGRCGVLVCEDAWHPMTSTLLALDGAQIIFICAAAPARGVWPRDEGSSGPASVARWERLVREIASTYGVFVSLSNLAVSEAGRFFPGASMVVDPRGDLRLRGPLWKEAVLSLPLDLDDLTTVRADAPLLADLRVALPSLLDSLEHIREGIAPELSYDAARPEYPERRSSPAAKATRPSSDDWYDVVRVSGIEQGGPPPLAIDAPLVEEWLEEFLRSELSQRGYSKGIVAISGGLDSAVTAYLAARALGPSNVIGVRLPYGKFGAQSLEHGQLVIDALGIESRTIDIAPAVDAYLANEPDADATRRGNVMARMRMIATFDLSARYAALPLGTGNKTERLLGYFTWHADDAPPVNPLGDLYKTQVRELAWHLGVPTEIIQKPPTADLVRGQTDEGDLGVSYESADVILHWLLSGYSVEQLTERGFTAADIATVRRRLEGTHWKRRTPTVAMLSGTAIGDSYLRPVDY